MSARGSVYLPTRAEVVAEHERIGRIESWLSEVERRLIALEESLPGLQAAMRELAR